MTTTVDLVSSVVAAWEQGDFSDNSWAHPEIEFVVDDSLSPATWHGVDELGKGWRSFLSSWEHYRIEVEEYLQLDEDRVLVLGRHTALGRRSGVDIGSGRFEAAILFELRDKLVVRLVAYLERSHALTELGL